MAFDINVIKTVYAKMSSKIDNARKIVGRPLTYAEKFYTLIYGMNHQRQFLKEVKIMLILVLTVLHAKMLQLRWHFFNLCKLERIK